MGQKTRPKALRLGITDNWDSNWYDYSSYGEKVLQDYNIRASLKKDLNRAGIDRILINRKSDSLQIDVYVSRSGLILGKAGLDMDSIKTSLEKKLQLKNISLNIIDIKSADSSASLLSAWICSQLEKRIAFRRAMKMSMQKALKAGVKGVKVACKGRLGGIEIARCEWYKEGKIPLHTLRADIDYSFSEANTTYGKIGVKVWLFKGEKLRRDELEVSNVKSKKN